MREKMGPRGDAIDAHSFVLGVQVGMLEFSRVASKTTASCMLDGSSVDTVVAEGVRIDAGASVLAHAMATNAIAEVVESGWDPTGREWFYTPGGRVDTGLNPRAATDTIGRMRGELGLRSSGVDAPSLLLGSGAGVMAFSSIIGKPAIIPDFGSDLLAAAGPMGRDAQISTVCVAIMNRTVDGFIHDMKGRFGNQWDE